MSYSRWSNSVWYSYWSCYSGPTVKEQVLCLLHKGGVRKDWTLEELVDLRVSDIKNFYDCPIIEAEEAAAYVEQFIADMSEMTDSECAKQYQQMLKDELGVSDD
jgi:hypothetical protein